MSSNQPKDRASLCLFTFTDGRRCRTPRTTGHLHFCFYHARKESQARVAESLGNDLNFFLSGEYLSANDLSAALGRIIPAVIRGDIKPRTASTVAYLAQTLLQTIQVAQHEYINAFGTPEWRETIDHNVNQNWNYRHPAPPSKAPSNPVPDSNPQPSSNPHPASNPAPSSSPPPTTPNDCHPERSEGSAFDSGGPRLQSGSAFANPDPQSCNSEPPAAPASSQHDESDSPANPDEVADPANDPDDAEKDAGEYEDDEEDLEFATVGDQSRSRQSTALPRSQPAPAPPTRPVTPAE